MSSSLFFTTAIALFLIALDFSSSQIPDVQKKYIKKIWKLEVGPILSATGPESLAFDPNGGGPYTGVSDGRIIKWEENQRQWINFAITTPKREGCEGPHDHDQTEDICGRPLGIQFNEATGDLYIADAYMGLLKVGPEGGLANRLATHAQGIPFAFTNGLDIDQRSGVVYFTDSSSRYQRRDHISVVLSGDKTGRLMKYDPETKQVTVLLDNLSYPNGLALCQDGSYLIFADTTNCRIMKYWLRTAKAGSLEDFAQLPGFPDNIRRSPRGGFWVGIHSRREKISEWVLSYPWIGTTLLRLPVNIMRAHSILAKYRGSGMAVRLSEDGDVVETLEDVRGTRWSSISEVDEKNGNLWIGSVDMPFVGVISLSPD